MGYISGAVLKDLRERKKLTQQQVADQLCVSAKTVSKWENNKGLPDIALLEPLSAVLGVSLPELLAGNQIVNCNRSGNMYRSKFYVCPLCGNVIHSLGDVVVSCCGVTLLPLEPEDPDNEHVLSVQEIEYEYYVSSIHPMKRDHYLSFVAYCTDERCELVKLYPEQDVSLRFFSRGPGKLFWYCNRHGLFHCRL